VEWVEIFAVFLVCHLAGDFLLQTEWQATHKRGGLGNDAVARRALVSHVAVYGLTFAPALVWLAQDLGAGIAWVAALITLPHLVQDDGRLLTRYIKFAKKTVAQDGELLFVAVDQTFHVTALFGIALLAAG
jgi:uncharacterized protein DUF3307